MFDISTINLIIGLIIGLFIRYIVSIVNKWRNKRNFKKILKRDVRLRLKHLKSIEKKILDSLDARTLQDAFIKLMEIIEMYYSKMGEDKIRYSGRFESFGNVSYKIPTDFYKNNYEQFLDYFDDKSNVVMFYVRLTTLNNIVDMMKEDSEKGTCFFEGGLFLSYLTHLEWALKEGKNISDL